MTGSSNFSVAVLEPLSNAIVPVRKAFWTKIRTEPVSSVCAGAEFSEGRKEAGLGWKRKNVYMPAFPFPAAVG